MAGQRLDGKVALITGATGGLGTATAELFAREGARLVITDVAEGPLRDLAHRIEARGAEVVAARLDVSSEREWNRERLLKWDVEACLGKPLSYRSRGRL